QNVWDDEDFFVGENIVSDRGGGAVGAFAQDLALDLVGILAGDDVFSGAGGQDVAFGGHHLRRIGSLGAGETHDCVVALAVFQQRVNINAIAVIESAIPLDDGDDLVADVKHKLGAVGAHVAKALHDDARAFAAQP